MKDSPKKKDSLQKCTGKSNIYSGINISVPLLDVIILCGIGLLILLVSSSV